METKSAGHKLTFGNLLVCHYRTSISSHLTAHALVLPVGFEPAVFFNRSYCYQSRHFCKTENPRWCRIGDKPD